MERKFAFFLLKVNQQKQFKQRHVWVYFSFVHCLIQFLQCFFFENRMRTAAGHTAYLTVKVAGTYNYL
jgi:hypothetical protein